MNGSRSITLARLVALRVEAREEKVSTTVEQSLSPNTPVASKIMGSEQGWKIHVMGVTLPRIRGFSYVTWQVFAILPINAMVAK